MVLILKKIGEQSYRIVKLSNSGYVSDCRIFDIVNNVCCDLQFNRIQLYRAIIEKMILEGMEMRIWNDSEVTNTLHDRIFRYFKDKNTDIYLVELDFTRFVKK